MRCTRRSRIIPLRTKRLIVNQNPLEPYKTLMAALIANCRALRYLAFVFSQKTDDLDANTNMGTGGKTDRKRIAEIGVWDGSSSLPVDLRNDSRLIAEMDSSYLEAFVSRTSTPLEDEMRQEILFITTTRFKEARKAGLNKLQKLLADEKRQSITYNHYYTDDILNAREDSLRGEIRKAIRGAMEDDFDSKFHVSNTTMDAERLLSCLEKRVVVNMDAQASAEAMSGLKVYYKVSKLHDQKASLTNYQVAIKTFVNSIC